MIQLLPPHLAPEGVWLLNHWELAMGEKSWSELTAEEKIEDLRKDFNHIMAQLNMLIRGQDALQSRVASLAAQQGEPMGRPAPLERKGEGKE